MEKNKDIIIEMEFLMFLLYTDLVNLSYREGCDQ